MASYTITDLPMPNNTFPTSYTVQDVTQSSGVFTYLAGKTAMVSAAAERPVPGHIYYARCYQKRPAGATCSDGRFELWLGDAQDEVLTFCQMADCPDDGAWHLASARVSLATPVTGSWACRSFVVNATADCQRKEHMLIDLTAAFGAGSEPTQAWCDKNLPYFKGGAYLHRRLFPGDVINCPYSGAARLFLLPVGQFSLECWGARGGTGTNLSRQSSYSVGGHSAGQYATAAILPLYLVCGGAGTDVDSDSDESVDGGFNGGGSGGSHRIGLYHASGGSGGGATHIATASGRLSALSGKQETVLMVAGGGSGGAAIADSVTSNGYAGGGETGGGHYGGTQSAAGGSGSHAGGFGRGGNGTTSGAVNPAGGGGGWYGGGGGDDDYAPGGGSGYVSAVLTGASTAQEETAASTNPDSARAGYIRITVLSVVRGIDYAATYHAQTLFSVHTDEETVAVTYGDSTLCTLAAGDTKTLKTAGKYATHNIVVGGKTLQCADKVLLGDVALSAVSS